MALDARDHGDLIGLTNDDHTQYVLVAGTRALTAYLDFNEIASPANPSANVGRLYVKDVGAVTKLYFKDSAGTDTDVLATGGDVVGPGSSTDNRVATFHSTTGKIIQDNTTVTINDSGDISTTGSIHIDSAGQAQMKIDSTSADGILLFEEAGTDKWSLSYLTASGNLSIYDEVNDKTMMLFEDGAGITISPVDGITTFATTGVTDKIRLYASNNSSYLEIYHAGVFAYLTTSDSDVLICSQGLLVSGNLSINDNNITNVGDIAVDSISSDNGSTITIATTGSPATVGTQYDSYKLRFEGYGWNTTGPSSTSKTADFVLEVGSGANTAVEHNLALYNDYDTLMCIWKLDANALTFGMEGHSILDVGYLDMDGPLALHTAADDPGGPGEGEMYYNTGDDMVHMYAAGQWWKFSMTIVE